ncbi:MAG: tRNA pseudouridine(38-40) synthase TruA [Rhodospirillales bacterium]|nr:tRNA pseudouridine(38-40) synthase TruA [Rhodospirillales bacterium]MBT4006966.1 tRNA pseudouridine(38-40) synthase TruA [Rhodospirillales bacterium]MBT5075340.1 tRNA pseudouridine(38-40) synthase TruA [Rhodospirillales bacterium]MBT5113007.1 tRNA pseudouridine(38-40) synthase TruA [Rhodospirillales bacterium]MBT5672883.1 tRNA pseudouridine(38-40) synthase TruA [Rhodospirillales bacterium]
MSRWRIDVEYDGRPFVGWQRQKSGLGVQAALEAAIKSFSGEAALVTGAGRTDAGVHARAQVAHFDLQGDWDADTVRDAVNFHLKPQPIAVLRATAVDDEFHARFSAKSREYDYRIITRRAPLALSAGHAWRVGVALDADAMDRASKVLLGHHDFTSFRAAQCQAKSPEKTLDEISVSRTGEVITLHLHAQSFLHNQVRIITGTLKLVGEGKWTIGDVEKALVACDRAAAGPTAPPDGLYLSAVHY